MSQTEPATAQHLDALIPPPWPTRRRVLALVLAAVAVAAVLVAVRSGALGPRLTHDGAWGSSVDTADPERLVAERIVRLRNDGWLTTAIDELVLPEHPDVTWGEVDGLPATLLPGEVHELTVGFEVAGCDVHLGGYDVFEVSARSGVAPARHVAVPAPPSSDPTMRTTYLDDGTETTLPAWPDQPPSWILDTIEPACAAPPDDSAG